MLTFTSVDCCGNDLLAALPPRILERWSPHLCRVELRLGMSVYEPGEILTHVYFPVTALVSLLHVLEDGSSAEIAMVGREGVVGVSIFLGGASTSTRGVVQVGGQALSLPALVVMEGFEADVTVRRLLLRFTQALISQMTQTAACNRHHHIEQQLCRWILLSLDRLPDPQVSMTQELISNMLGVRRVGVTQAAAKLQADGLIRYRRGHITVLDRPGLERRVCECYQAVRHEYERLLPQGGAD